MFNKPHRSVKTAFLLMLLTLMGSLALTQAAAADRIDLNGNWQFKPAKILDVTPDIKPPETIAWQSIQVPDNWFRQGYDISGHAWYRKQFDIRPAMLNKQLRLIFEGIDYEADVWLNNQYLGRHTGYFQTFDFDISKQVNAGKNTLTVLVNSPLEQLENGSKPQDWSLHKRILKGIFSHHDTRPGGAWSPRGQEQNTGGIWAPVSIEISNGVAVRQLQVQTSQMPEKIPDRPWQLQSKLALSSQLADATSVEIIATVTPDNFKDESQVFKRVQAIQPGDSSIQLDLPLKNPRLWWPVGHGQPNLYRLQVRIVKNGRELTQKTTLFGVRSISMDAATQQWQVNGRRLFVRGTNYISSQWLAEMTPQAYARDIQLMKAANINAVRVHAHIEAPAFYEACDRNGLLVLQDYMLQWGYQDSDAFISEARRQAVDMVTQLGNHPSIAVWSLHNEPPWDSPWMQHKYANYNPEQNRRLDDLLYADIAQLEQKRIVKKVSPTQEHVWIGWYFGRWQDFANPAPAPWVTEFGAQALPNLASLKKIFKPDVLWPDSEQKWQQWEYHNFQRHETFELAQVKQGDNIEAFIANTQAYQARLTQYAAESYRRQRYAPVTALFQFMFNEDWPSVNWGIVDYWRQPKPGYQALKTAYQPILPSIEWTRESYQAGETASVGLWLINDTWQSIPNARYVVSVSRNGQPLPKPLNVDKIIQLEIAADSGRKLEQLNIPQLQSGQYRVSVKVLAANGRQLGQNAYHFNVLP